MVAMSISDALQATVDQLNALHAPIAERKGRDFEKLVAVVSRLDERFESDPEEPMIATRPGSDGPRRRDEPRPDRGEPPLPRTEGNRWGPAMRAQFIAEARDKGDW